MNVFGYDIRLVRNSDKKKKRNVSIGFYSPMRERLVFSQSDVLMAMKMISSRLSNVVYSFDKLDELSPTCKCIKKWLYDNRLQLVQRLFNDGYFILRIDEKRNSYTFVDDLQGRITKQQNIANVSLFDNEIVITSETFEASGKSDFDFLKDKLRFLDSINSSDFNLIENYGAMGIVSPESDNSVAGAEFTEEDIKDLQGRYKEHYGITVGKWSLMFVPRPSKYSKIDLPIAQLQLSEKRLYCLKAIFSAFGIPKELSVYFENTTFENRNQAELDMYSNTISAWARIFCNTGMAIYNNIQKRESFLLPNDLYFDIKGVLAIQESQQKEKQNAREELKFWLELKGTMPEYAEIARQRIDDLVENL